jgi:hypothetical protein
VDKRIAHAVSFKLRCPEVSIPEAVRATKFTLEESLNTAKQMAFRRAYEKAIGAQKNVPSAVSVTKSKRTGSSLSPMTELTATTASAAPQTPVQDDGADVVIQPKPKPGQIRNTASGMQKRRVNKFDATDHSKRAFKRAMSWYKREQEKSYGLSSREIAKRVKLEFDKRRAWPRQRQQKQQMRCGWMHSKNLTSCR